MPVLVWVGMEGWGTKEEVSDLGSGGRCPELSGAAAGGDLGDGRAAGGLERPEGVVELTGGLVVFEGVADLARVRCRARRSPRRRQRPHPTSPAAEELLQPRQAPHIS